MAVTYRISPETASRTMSLIAYHGGDLAAAIYDTRLVLRSLGNYTDRASERVLDLLLWIQVRDTKFPDSIERRREQLAQIAAKAA